MVLSGPQLQQIITELLLGTITRSASKEGTC